MWTVDGYIDEARQHLEDPEDCRELSADEAAEVVRKAMAVFVEGNPRVWWLKLKNRRTKIPVADDNVDYLDTVFPKDQPRCYFIPENDAKVMRVFDATLRGVKTVVKNSNGSFEYNLVGHGFDWLICENEHGELIVCHT
jgi:hypothetical protein